MVDGDTGEYLGRGIFVSEDQVKSEIKEQEKKKQKITYFSKNNYVKDLGKGLGFYFSNYDKLLKKLNNDYALAFRFMYLCTYADYENLIYFSNNYAEEKDLKEIFNLTENTIDKIKKQLLESKLIRFIDGKIEVNQEYFIKGAIKEDFKKNSCRVFNNGLRELYKMLKATEHKKIGKIVPLLEYMHYENNILCSDPTVKTDDIEPLSIKDIGKIININGNNYNRAVNDLLNVTVNEKPLLAVVRKLNKSVVVVNPSIFYKGSNKEELKWLVDFFDLNI